jgi:hypothetical protein
MALSRQISRVLNSNNNKNRSRTTSPVEIHQLNATKNKDLFSHDLAHYVHGVVCVADGL